MMTTPSSAGADGYFQSPSLWTIPTILEFDTSSADGLTEQWLTVVGKTRPHRQDDPAAVRQPLAADCHDAQLIPEPDVVAPSVTDAARSSSHADDLDGHSAPPADGSAVRVSPAEDERPAPETLPNEGVVACREAQPPEQVTASTALIAFSDTAISWPAGRSIDTYIHRVEAAQLALLITRIDAGHVEAQRLRARRQLRRAMSAFAVGAAASALFVALARRVDSRVDVAAPAAAVHRQTASPLDVSVTFWSDAGPEASGTTITGPGAPATAPTASGTGRKKRQL